MGFGNQLLHTQTMVHAPLAQTSSYATECKGCQLIVNWYKTIMNDVCHVIMDSASDRLLIYEIYHFTWGS